MHQYVKKLLVSLLEKVNSSLKKKNLEFSPATSKLEISSSKII